MNDKNNNLGGSPGMKDISQMSMGSIGGTGTPVKRPSRNTMPDLRQYKKPALFAAAGLVALVLLVIVVKALSGGRYHIKDYEEAAMLMLKMPLTEKELDAWEDNLKDCYPPEAKEILKEIYSGGESYVEIMAEMEEADEEEFELFQKMMSCFKVSDSRMLDQEECEECEELIRKNHDITIEIDGGCLVEVEIVPDSKMEKMLKELGIDLEDLDDTRSVMLVLRSGKYIGPWASAGGLELDEITSLRRDLEWR